MRLVYKDTGVEVKVGDEVDISGEPHLVSYFREPHKPNSSGKIVVTPRGIADSTGREYYVGIIGAKWIEREDQR